jgi:hypothetical protein
MEIVQPLQAIHLSKQDETLAKVFNKICGNGIPFLAPHEFDEILAEIPIVANQIEDSIGGEKVNTTWGLNLIEDMLEKGYNPAALSSTLASANLCIDSLKSLSITEQQISIVELGTGAGWSTLILYNLLHHHFSSFVLCAIDESPYAIGCTAKMLVHFGIPYQIIAKGKIVQDSSVNPKMPKVILHVQDFISALEQLEKKSVYAVYSNHGTAYLDSAKHAEMLTIVHLVLIPNGVFIADSLDPQISMNLSKKFVISSIFMARNKERFGRIPVDKQYQYCKGDNGLKILRVMRDESAANFLDWLSYLLYSGQIGVFKKYLSALRRSVNTQQKIREWVQIPSNKLHAQAHEAGLSGWQSSNLPQNYQVPYIQTVRLVKQTKLK